MSSLHPSSALNDRIANFPAREPSLRVSRQYRSGVCRVCLQAFAFTRILDKLIAISNRQIGVNSDPPLGLRERQFVGAMTRRSTTDRIVRVILWILRQSCLED